MAEPRRKKAVNLERTEVRRKEILGGEFQVGEVRARCLSVLKLKKPHDASP